MIRNTALALAGFLTILFGLSVIQAKPTQPEKKGEAKQEKDIPFKPVDINEALDDNDPKDPKNDHPAKRYTIKLQKDKTYVIDMVSKDFDTYLRLLNKKGDELTEDDDGGGGGELNSRIIHSATKTEDHQIVATTFDGKVGKFSLKVRELQIKAEEKARKLDKNPFEHNGVLAQVDKTDLSDLSKVITLDLKSGMTYQFEIDAPDFDAELYAFDGKNRLLGHDASKFIATATKNGPHNLVVVSFDNMVGKFNLKVREFKLQGEAKPREVGKKGLSITANINQNDNLPIDKLGKIYSVELKKGQSYTINLSSGTLDSYLYLFDGDSRQLMTDDDSGGGVDSRIIFRPEADGVFHILATTLDGTETGEFTLEIRKTE